MKRKPLNRFTPLRAKKPWRPERQALRAREQTQKKCQVCEQLFDVYPYQATTRKFCSPACAGIGRRKRVERACAQCGQTFEKVESQMRLVRNAGTYCSMACMYAAQEDKAAKRPVKDQYGRSKRKADTEWKLAVREKDESLCQRCGVYDPYIHTHHVATRAQRPDLKHDVSNGKCLCGPCHQWVHHNPLEAEAVGLLSNARYELERSKVRIEKTRVALSLRENGIPGNPPGRPPAK